MNARSRKSNEPILDFDPVTDSQDPQVERLSIAAESVSVVAATFFSGAVKHVVKYDFKPEGGGFKIDDISGGSGADAWDLGGSSPRKEIGPAPEASALMDRTIRLILKS